MIKVLVVDDDKLVRRGLISFIPWHEFNMEVVGEAGNGEKALDFLQFNAVDLLITDLSMPIMSGIELIRITRQQYPQLHVVVLTLHQDFEYIQEALRLGAIDYIAKVQLEEEQFEEILGRIVSRINERSNSIPKSVNYDELVVRHNYSFALLSMDSKSENSWVSELELPNDVIMLESHPNCWVWFATEEQYDKVVGILSEKMRLELQSVLLIINNKDCHSWKAVQRWLRYYMERNLFYEYHPDRRIINVSMNAIASDYNETDESILENVKASWVYSTWFYNDELFEKLIGEMKLLKLQEKQLMGLLYSFVIEWNRLFVDTKLGKIQMLQAVYSWYEVEKWLCKIQKHVKQSIGQPSYSQEIMDYMTKAVLMVQNEIDRQLTAAELAQRLNLSRSYFSQCFKDIIGKTYNEYSRFVRIEKAKEYLLNTNHTIVWIAGRTGYTDEKYFSRIFRELTGSLPSEYRLNNRKTSI